MFKEAWEKAFYIENIESAQEAVRIHSFNSERVISTVVRRQTPSVEESEPSQKFKTPNSNRSLRYTFRRLQNKGKVHPNTIVLLYASEKLATNLDIVQYKNAGLRKTIIHKKKKRKYGKAMHLYDKGEKEGQALFFSPEKIARVRERVAAAQEAERQRQQAISDRKLQ